MRVNSVARDVRVWFSKARLLPLLTFLKKRLDIGNIGGYLDCRSLFCGGEQENFPAIDPLISQQCVAMSTHEHLSSPSSLHLRNQGGELRYNAGVQGKFGFLQ